MSLYNALFGNNPLSDVLLAIINLPADQIPRFRDTKIAEGGKQIMVFTRTGGGNREEYGEQNDAMTKHPLYVSDRDSDFDSTYAEFYFRVPDEFLAQVVALAEQDKGTTDPMGQFKVLLDNLAAGKKDDPQVQRALEVGKKIMGQVGEAMENGGGGIIEV